MLAADLLVEWTVFGHLSTGLRSNLKCVRAINSGSHSFRAILAGTVYLLLCGSLCHFVACEAMLERADVPGHDTCDAALGYGAGVLNLCSYSEHNSLHLKPSN